jgi:membrane protease YdiL (CAAX protease family)
MRRYAKALAFMAAAVLAQWVSLAVFNSLLLSFVLYSLIACLALPLADMLLFGKVPPGKVAERLRLVPASGKSAGIALALGLAMDGIMVAAFLVLGSLFMREGKAVEVVGRWGITRGAQAAFCFAALVLNGGIEELFWRGYIHDTLKDSACRPLAVGIPALIFGAQHFFVISRLVPNAPSVALFMLAIIGSGFLWGIIREKGKDLFLCALCHMVVAVGYLSILGAYLFG